MRWLRSVGLIGILAIAGCSSGGSTSSFSGGGGATNNNNNNNNNQPSGISTLSFSVPNFNSTKQATLLRRNMPSTETGGTASITTNSTNRADFGSENPGRDLPPELVAQDLEAIKAAPVSSRAEILPKFQEIPKGSDQAFFIVTTGSTVTTRKILSDAQTIHCTIFAQVVGGNPVIDEATAIAVAEAFDSQNPFKLGGGIYDQDRDIFGSEWNAAGGRDGDLKINLVFLNSAGIGGSQYFGFVRPGDENAGGTSNEGEIIYLNADKFANGSFDVLSTIAHEFQHLIALNTKLIRQGAFNGQAENPAIDEGKSTLAEDLLGYGLEATGGGNNFMYQACRSFLNSPGASGLFVFSGNLDSYGRDYAFMRYLVDRFGLASFQSYAKSNGTGLAQLNASYGSLNSVFSDWNNALVASNLSGSVPSNFLYTGPFRPGRTYAAIRQLAGAQTLPTLAGTVVTPGTTLSTTLGAWVFNSVIYRNGTGNTLNISVQGEATQGASLVIESPTGTYSGAQ